MKKTIEILIVAWALITAFILALVSFHIRYPLRFKDEIIKFSGESHLSPAFVASVINAESHFNKDARSNVGAIGLMQLLPKTAEFINEKDNLNLKISDLCNIDTNIALGCAYLHYLLEKFTDKFTVLCAYNAGEGNVNKWLTDEKYSQNHKTLTYTPFPATNYYATKVLHDEKIYRKFFV